jgi:hypothetical protein
MMAFSRVRNSDWRRTTWLENLDAADPWTRYAIKETFTAYGENVSVEERKGAVRKFGYSAQVGGSVQVTIMTLGSNETAEDYVSANSITHVASSSTAVVGVAAVSGYTISGNDLTLVNQTVTLAGQTKTALTTPLARAHRIVNNSTLDWTSNVYVARNVTFTNGIPQDSSAIHLVGVAVDNQSQKAAFSTASDEYGFVTKIHASLAKNSGVAAQADVRLRVRPQGEVFQTKWQGAVGSASNRAFVYDYGPYLIVPPNADIILTANSSGTGVEMTGGFDMILASIV